MTYDLVITTGSSVCSEDQKSPAFSLALCHMNPLLHSACKLMLQ